MKGLEKIWIVLAFGFSLFFPLSTNARYRVLATDLRSANEYEERNWVEPGEIIDTETGVRLDGGAKDLAGFAAISYRFEVPAGTKGFRVEIHYQDESKEDRIAGELVVSLEDKDFEEENLIYGDALVLPSKKTSQTFELPIKRYLKDQQLTIHARARNGDCLEVQDLKVEYLEEKPKIRTVYRYSRDYWERWPDSYYYPYYYFWTPRCYWCYPGGYYVVYVIPADYYWGCWRPWFRSYVCCDVYCGCYPSYYSDCGYVFFDDPPAKTRWVDNPQIADKSYRTNSKPRAGFQKNSEVGREKERQANTEKSQIPKKKPRFYSRSKDDHVPVREIQTPRKESRRQRTRDYELATKKSRVRSNRSSEPRVTRNVRKEPSTHRTTVTRTVKRESVVRSKPQTSRQTIRVQRTPSRRIPKRR